MEGEPVKIEYIHYPLNEEITAIGGHYVITGENRVPAGDREVFYTVGYGVMDTTCCGTGGCGYATVHGYIVDWKGELNKEGLQVSILESIGDEALKQKLREELLQSEIVQQVNFL